MLRFAGFVGIGDGVWLLINHGIASARRGQALEAIDDA